MGDGRIMPLLVGFIIWILYTSYQMDVECNEKGGILVRGAIKYECVKSLEKVE